VYYRFSILAANIKTQSVCILTNFISFKPKISTFTTRYILSFYCEASAQWSMVDIYLVIK